MNPMQLVGLFAAVCVAFALLIVIIQGAEAANGDNSNGDDGQRAAPLIMIGGQTLSAPPHGFVMVLAPGSDISAPMQNFAAEIHAATCLAAGRAVLSVGTVLHDGDPATGAVSTLELDGEARTMIPVILSVPIPTAQPAKGDTSPVPSAQTMDTVVVLVGGTFSGGLLVWDGKTAQAITPSLGPSCVNILALAPDLTGDIIVGGCFQGLSANGVFDSSQTGMSAILRMSLTSGGPQNAQFFAMGSGLVLQPTSSSAPETLTNPSPSSSSSSSPPPPSSNVLSVTALTCAAGCVFAGGVFSHSGSGVSLNNVGMICMEEEEGSNGGSGGASGSPAWRALEHMPSKPIGDDNSAAAQRYQEQKWGDWQPMTLGVSGTVHVMLAVEKFEDRGVFIFVGGHFCAKSDLDVCNIAEWSVGLGWKGLGRGVRGSVFSLLRVGHWVYVGGRFVNPDTRAENLAAWSIGNLNPGRWGTGGLPEQERSPGKVNALSPCPCPPGMMTDGAGACMKADLAALVDPKQAALSRLQNRELRHAPPTASSSSSFLLIVIIVFLGIASFVLWKARVAMSSQELHTWEEIGQHEPIAGQVGTVADWYDDEDDNGENAYH